MDLNNKVGSVYNLSRVFYFQSCKNNLAGNLKDNVVVLKTVSLKSTAAVLARILFCISSGREQMLTVYIT